jgi:hypothetical protein
LPGLLAGAGRQGARWPTVSRSNTKHIPKVFARALYRGRARIEQAVGKPRRSKHIALRCEKTRRNFASFIKPVAAFILIKSVHTA